MKNIIALTKKKITALSTINTSSNKCNSPIVLDFQEQKNAFYTGKASGYKIAIAILQAAKNSIKEIKIINSKVVTIKNYTYATYLRILFTLKNIIINNNIKSFCKNELQAKRLRGQIHAISEVINDLKSNYQTNNLIST